MIDDCAMNTDRLYAAMTQLNRIHITTKVAKKLLLYGRIIHYCPLLARKLENGLETKTPYKSMKYKGIMWWPRLRPVDFAGQAPRTFHLL